MSRVPRIRFKGFEEDWEQRKLGEIADKVVEKNFQLQERDVFTNSAEFGIIDQKNFFDHEIVNKNNIGGYYIVSPNDFVYNPRISVTAPVGPINRNKLCKRGIMSPLYTVFHPRNMNETFLEFYFRTNKWHKFMEYNGDSGARSDRFSIKTELFYAMTIPFPSHKEQSKVGICFESLDNLITLHQRKLEKLKIIKKSMLENLFPQNGEKTPKIRFSGFTKDWEQRKLGEIAERIIRKNEKLESTLPLTISAQYGLIDQNEFFDKRIASKDVRGYYLIKKGEFAYNKSTSVDAPLGAIKRLDKYKNGVLSTLYILFKIIDDTSTSSDYLVTYYATDLWHRGIQSIAAEGARNHGLLNIAPNDFFETMLSIPFNISEQKKVGDFFITLDYLITLHQSKLDKLQKIKKSMLESMFV